MSMVSLSVFRVPVLVRPLPAIALACLMAVAASACDSAAQSHGPGTGGAGGAGGAGGTTMPAEAATAAGFAVLSSDYSATSVTLVDPLTGTVHDDCVHSGTSGAKMPQMLSGDATLPSQPQHNGALAVIDRKNATITYADPATCEATLQFAVSTGGFKSNPHDVISVSAEKVYVTRYEKNAAPTAAAGDFDDGDDIVVVNAKTGVISGSIPLSGELVAGVDPSVQARPDRGVLAGGKVYVVLGAISADFAAAGPGRVVVIDPATDKVTGAIDLPEQKGCSAIEYQKDTKKLYVACGGSFVDGPDQAKYSALVEIDIASSPPAVTRTIKAAAVGGQPINFSYAAVLGDFAFIGTLGSFPDAMAGTPGSSDAVWGAALDGTAAAKLLDGGAYNLGRATVDATFKKLLVPDGDFMTPRVRIFDLSGVPITEGTPFEANPAGHLPPREIAWY